MIKSTAIDPSVVGADGVYRMTGPAAFSRPNRPRSRRSRRSASQAGDVLVLICRGPMGAGMEETYQLTGALRYLPFGKHVAVVTDARFSGVSTGACIGHVSPEALAGGPIGKLRTAISSRSSIDTRDARRTVNFVGEAGVDAARKRARAFSSAARHGRSGCRRRSCPTTRGSGRRSRTSAAGTWGGSRVRRRRDPGGDRRG